VPVSTLAFMGAIPRLPAETLVETRKLPPTMLAKPDVSKPMTDLLVPPQGFAKAGLGTPPKPHAGHPVYAESAT